VEEMLLEFPGQAIGKGIVRRSKEMQEITAKMGHCPEVDGSVS
jgi:hypothetical protein